MEYHTLKFVSKENVTDREKIKLLEVVRRLDPSADFTTNHPDNELVKTLIISLTRCLHEKELEKINDELATDMDNYFVETLCEEGEEEDEVKDGPGKLFTVAEVRKTFRDHFEPSFKEMCDEMELRNHNRLIEKRAQMGWKFGDRFDPLKKESPMMKPYDQLPEEYKLQNGKIFEDVLDILQKNGFYMSHITMNKLKKK